MKKKDRPLWVYVVATISSVAVQFDLPVPDVRPIKKKWRGKFAGSCSKRGIIRIALRDSDGKLVEPYELLDTISHEIAHLMTQKHDPLWFQQHVKILSHLTKLGVYTTLRRLIKGK